MDKDNFKNTRTELGVTLKRLSAVTSIRSERLSSFEHGKIRLTTYEIRSVERYFERVKNESADAKRIAIERWNSKVSAGNKAVDDAQAE